MKVTFDDETKEITKKFAETAEEIEVMEVRLFLRDSKLLWVEPINPAEMNETKMTGRMEYNVEIVPFDADELERRTAPEADIEQSTVPAFLIKEGVQQISTVAFKQNSPACSYWYTESTANGIVKICLF